MIKVYYACSIRGGRDKSSNYELIASIINKYANILDKHVYDNKLTIDGEKLKDEIIYQRDIAMIKDCDILIAEVSNPSLGVGYEIGYAEKLNKKIVCLCESNINLSAMINGNKNIRVIYYEKIGEIENKLKKYLEE